MDEETAQHLTDLQESITLILERLRKLDASNQAILRSLKVGIPEFSEAYQTNFEDLLQATKAPSDAAALEKMLEASLRTLPKTGQA